jgi:hypothetical protein
MSAQRIVRLDNGAEIGVEETVSLDNERVVTMFTMNAVTPSFEGTFTPDEAEQLGLALIAVAGLARAKDAKPEVFGHSASPRRWSIQEPPVYGAPTYKSRSTKK